MLRDEGKIDGKRQIRRKERGKEVKEKIEGAQE